MPEALGPREVDHQQQAADRHQWRGKVVCQLGDRPVALDAHQVDQCAHEVGAGRDPAEVEVKNDPPAPGWGGDDSSFHSISLSEMVLFFFMYVVFSPSGAKKRHTQAEKSSVCL